MLFRSDGQRYLAADTGVTGQAVDLCMESHAEVTGQAVDLCMESHAAALAFGVQTAEIWVLPAERGAI